MKVIILGAKGMLGTDWTAVCDREAIAVTGCELPEWDFCASRGMPLLHLSTDYVFDGTGRTPYGVAGTTLPAPLWSGYDPARRCDPCRARRFHARPDVPPTRC